MGLYETTQLYLGLAVLFAALTIIRYSRSKSAELGADQKSAVKPLYIIAFGILFYSLGALSIYIEDTLGIWILFDTYMAYYACAMVEVISLSVAAVMIMNSRRLYAIPVAITMATSVLFGSAFVFEQTTEFLWVAGFFLPAIVLVFVGGVFVWIARGTGRSISAALSFALITQIAGLPVIYFSSMLGSEFIYTLFIVLMGPAMIVFSFLRPDQKVSFELVGYGASFAGPAIIIAGLQNAGLTTDPYFLAIAGMGAIAVLFSLGTGAYLYGRWRDSGQIPTGLMMTSFFLLAVGQISGMLGNFEVIPSPDAFYIEFILTGYALAILAVGAIYAAGWKTAGLVPILAYLPISIMTIQAYPADIATVFMNLMYITVPTIGIMILPSLIFIGVWWKMRSRQAPGRLRPLGVALAIFLFFAIRLPPLIAELSGLDYGYGWVVLSFGMFWTALTGRLDRIAGTV
ncbi:MAG: hypothetical protein ACFFAX_10290 [Promethearchaeota archaeon]